MMPETWLVARNSDTRSRCSLGKMTLKRLSNEKNTEVDMQARNMTHSIEFLAMMRSACAYGVHHVGAGENGQQAEHAEDEAGGGQRLDPVVGPGCRASTDRRRRRRRGADDAERRSRP